MKAPPLARVVMLAHPTFSPDGKRILLQSGLLSDGKNLNLMTVTIPEYLQNPH